MSSSKGKSKMKTIMVMFDSLNREMLSPYGCSWTHTPNFARLAERSVVFDNSYVCSMPCMPARRELHTGRSNFLHRGWCPIEPFDDSMPEILRLNGIPSHMVTDHHHYWEDGGATYHTRYSSFKLVRGQEGDPCHELVDFKPNLINGFNRPSVRKGSEKYDQINLRDMDTEEKMPQTCTFDGGLEFLRDNHQSENWFLQIETFDPHEPFHSAKQWRELFPENKGITVDWPPYDPVAEDAETVSAVRHAYAGLLAMCDHNLGRVLDAMDKYNLWEDTMLIVNTDHGFLLGEHGWWAKSIMPLYNEIAHTPLFIYDPRTRAVGHRNALVQTIDLAPTILKFMGLEPTADMLGKDLAPTIAGDKSVRDCGIYGFHGQQINITDGKYVFMKAPAAPLNQPLFDYTLMPTHMWCRFSVEELQDIGLQEPFSFTKGCRTMKINSEMGDHFYRYGNKLFNVEEDPGQTCEILDFELQAKYANHMVRLMKENDAPVEQYERMGLPRDRPVTAQDMKAEQERYEQCYFCPDFAPELKWEGMTVNELRTISQLAGEGAQEDFAVYLKENGISTVTDAVVSDFVTIKYDEDTAEKMHYFMQFTGRRI